jgi:hypothetical protein
MSLKTPATPWRPLFGTSLPSLAREMNLSFYGENPEDPSGPHILISDAKIKRVAKAKPEQFILPDMTIYTAEGDMRRTPEQNQAILDKYSGTKSPKEAKIRTTKVVHPHMEKFMMILKDRIGELDA